MSQPDYQRFAEGVRDAVHSIAPRSGADFIEAVFALADLARFDLGRLCHACEGEGGPCRRCSGKGWTLTDRHGG